MELDYERIGFRCGIEVHQQIGANKLFCKCPTINAEGPCDYQITRRLRGVVGETGELDIAAKFESEKGKYFIYEGHSESTCLIELDESPPNPISEDALEIALKIALILNAKIVDEIQVMRKIVVDGSNVSGFQRTALVAMDGIIDTSLGKIRIPTICLEEEAAQKTEENKDFVRFRLDRLGIPLIEIATSADIKSPEHAKETAGYLGMVLRSVEGVRRGLGTIRQDVNISIKGGARTEIKGFQDLRSIPKVIGYEVKRQLDAVKNGKKIEREVRKAEGFTTSFLRPLPGAARLYPETDVLPVRVDKDYIEKLRKELPKLLIHKIYEFEKKYDLSKELAKEAAENESFEYMTQKFPKIEPSIIAHTLISVPKEIKSRFNLDSSKLAKKDFEEALSCYNESKISSKEAIFEILIKKIKNEEIDLTHFQAVSEEELEKEIGKIIKEKPELSVSAYMGLAMAKYRGKADGEKVMGILKKCLAAHK